MFTSNVRHPNDLLADFCTLACDYAQQSYLKRQEAALAAEQQTTEVLPTEVEVPEPAPTPEPVFYDDDNENIADSFNQKI